MELGKYKVYNIHYDMLPDKNISTFSALVSTDDLTRAELLLKEDIKKKGKSVDNYVLNAIESTNKKSDREEVISNTLA